MFLTDLSDFAAVNEIYGKYFIGAAAGAFDHSSRGSSQRRQRRNRNDRRARMKPVFAIAILAFGLVLGIFFHREWIAVGGIAAEFVD